MENAIERANNSLAKYLPPKALKTLTLIGFLYLASKTLSSLYSFQNTFLHIGYNLANRYGQGTWAIITGGAQGIGAAFAHQLAIKGFKLVLIDYNRDKLEETATNLRAKFPEIQVKTLVVDFTNAWKTELFDGIMKQLKGLDISVLINNVGTGTVPAPFHKVPEADTMRTLSVNMLPMTILCRRIIPLMLAREKRSAIINLASITGVFPTPMITNYSSTKAYVDFFSRALQIEVRYKIDVLSVRPDAVSTALINNPKLGSYVIEPEKVASSALRKLGQVDYTHGHWKHEVKGWIARNYLAGALLLLHFYKSVLNIPLEMLK